MKINLILLILGFLFASCNSQLADLSPIHRTPIHLETTNADSFTTMMIWATNGSHSFARSYTSAPVLDEELPKGNYEFYAATFDGAPFLLKCARVNQRLQGKMNFITLDFQVSTCADPAFLGPDPDLNLAVLPSVNSASTGIEFCEDLSSINQGSDQCTDKLDELLRKSGRGHASSYRISMMTFEKNTQDPGAGVAFSYCSGEINSTSLLRGDSTTSIINSFLPGNGSAPFFIRFQFYQSSIDCSGDPVVVDLPRGLGTGEGKSKLIVSPGSPASKKIFVKLAGPEICQGGRLAQEFAGGSGSQARPHLICNATQLRNIFPSTPSASVYQDYAGRSYKLLANIDLSTEPQIGGGYNPPWASCVLNGSNFMPIGTTWDGVACGSAPIASNFNFDGGGYEIKGLRILRSVGETGFYKVVAPSTGTSTIQRLRFRGSRIEGGRSTGTVVGDGTNLKLNRITLVEPFITSGFNRVGGVIGAGTNVRMEDIKVENISVTGASSVGGAAGYISNSGAITSILLRNRVTGLIQGQEQLGGITGAWESSGLLHLLNESRFKGEIRGTRLLGGLVGRAVSLRVENSYSLVKITSTLLSGIASESGGLVGAIQAHTASAGIYTSYSFPNITSNCDLASNLCLIGALIGSKTIGYDSTHFQTSVYPSSFPFTPLGGNMGIPQPDSSFQSYTPGWTPPFDTTIWEFQNGAYPRLLNE